jgi:hypothetical protein
MKYVVVKVTFGSPPMRRLFGKVLTDEFNRYLEAHPRKLKRLRQDMVTAFLNRKLQ